MCTVSYLPKSHHDFILTSNRDESPLRSSDQLVHKKLEDGQEIIFPQDPLAGGSWIGFSSSGRLLCLLNGAFERQERKPPYRRSRGLVLLDAFDYPRMSDFFEQYAFEGIEAFTLITYDQGQLIEFRWDEKERFIRSLDTRQAYIWSSATLYTAPYRLERERLFASWLKDRKSFKQEDILSFHQEGGSGDRYNDFVMNRANIVRTVSISSIEKRKETFHLQHRNLLTEQLTQESIEIAAREKPLASD